MTNTMIERVARSLCKKKLGVGLLVDVPSTYIDKYWQNFTDQARLAIEAMREPTEEMCNATYESEGPAETWRAMIDCILEEDNV